MFVCRFRLVEPIPDEYFESKSGPVFDGSCHGLGARLSCIQMPLVQSFGVSIPGSHWHVLYEVPFPYSGVGLVADGEPMLQGEPRASRSQMFLAGWWLHLCRVGQPGPSKAQTRWLVLRPHLHFHLPQCIHCTPPVPSTFWSPH